MAAASPATRRSGSDDVEPLGVELVPHSPSWWEAFIAGRDRTGNDRVREFRARDRCEIMQARNAVTPYVFVLIEAGQTDEQRLVVSALTYLKSLEKRDKAAKR